MISKFHVLFINPDVFLTQLSTMLRAMLQRPYFTASAVTKTKVVGACKRVVSCCERAISTVVQDTRNLTSFPKNQETRNLNTSPTYCTVLHTSRLIPSKSRHSAITHGNLSPLLTYNYCIRSLSSQNTSPSQHISDKLSEMLTVHKIDVQDISGGCGAMFQIYIQADEFNGMRTLQQHKLVKSILKEEVANMHGLTIKTEPTDR